MSYSNSNVSIDLMLSYTEELLYWVFAKEDIKKEFQNYFSF